MDDAEFDRALVAAGFALAGEIGWSRVSVTEAARAAGLPLDRARGRFMGRHGILARFGRIADQRALAQATTDGTHRDRLFDLLMRRIDALQAHRAGVLALKRYLPGEPALTAMLGLATLASMAWMLEAAGISAQGFRGALRTQGLLGVWLCALRAWERDESEDLSATMRALDTALDRAERAERWLHLRGRNAAAPPEPPPEPSPAAAAEDAPPAPPPLPAAGHEPPLPPPDQPIPPPA
jgi:hypothetical protein